MNKWSYIIAAVGAAALLSCEKEIKYKGNGADSRLVVNGVIEKDSVVKVQLQRSRFFLESTNGDYAITSNAVVTLTDLSNGQVYTAASAGADGWYDLGVASVSGHEYKIEVVHPDYPVAGGVTRVPATVSIVSVDTSSYQQENGIYRKANITWNDPAGADYYVMKLAVWSDAQNMDVYPQMHIASFDPALDELSSSDLESENYTNYLFFTDELFDGTQKTLEIRFSDIASSPDEHYKYILFRCSEEAYKYLVSAEKVRYSGDDPFSEPVKVFTNITNGFGIFGALSRSVYIQ